MLAHLTVRNFAIVEHLELTIRAGMTVMTGETGAGKSILVDALGLALGGRATGGIVKAGCARAEVSAVFELSPWPAIQAWLRERELDEDFEGDEHPAIECILRRSVAADGRTRAHINGRPVPVQTLRELGERLVDIHGQHAHQSLLKSNIQRDVIDAYAGNGADRGAIAGLYADWKAKGEEIARHAGDHEDHGARLEWLRFQVEELRALDLSRGEFESLDEEHRRIGHAAEITGTCHTILDRLEAEPGNAALVRVETSLRLLDDLIAFDDRLEEIRALLDTAGIHLREGAEALRQYANRVDMDEERLRWLESRLATLHDVARKHRIPPTELMAFLEQSETEIQRVEQSATLLSSLREERAEIECRYRDLALGLREKRMRAAAEFSEEITANLRQLGMPGGRMEVIVSPQDEHRPAPAGSDEITFAVTMNPGQPAKPLAQVASGGELSRVALAIQVLVSTGTAVPTLIFDEVDAGVGGQVAEIVGRRLRELGRTRQVLCVTHLPQVASQADHHVKVQKQVADDSTKTALTALTGEERVREIARMLGGVEITEKTLAHAGEMLTHSLPDAP
uniref:DNA repair protein RecN n=1 Tax=Candidatus Kentrum sp. DK TaxID=2126562 RepID=A0A450RUP5_9GAMM|nr:MAG: DNA replication and repair protein RecN [Candidatus Kentron sp. DK]